MFGVSFDEIAPIVDRSPAAARQLASRARRRVRGAAPGAVWAPDGRPRAVWHFTIVDGRIAAIELVADPTGLAGLDITLLDV